MQDSSLSGIPIENRIGKLRKVMQEKNIDAYIVATSDPHLSEYLPLHWQSRQWLSGFDGSAGTLVVTMHSSGLWTDSRYWVQAEKQLDKTEIELMKVTGGNYLAYADWLVEHLSAGMRVALDGQLMGLGAARKLEDKFNSAGLHLRTDDDLISAVWLDRPDLPLFPVFEHSEEFVALSRHEKLESLRQKMSEADADWHLISTLDDIAWLLNLRGADIEFNPLFISHLLVGKHEAKLFIEAEKISSELKQLLAADGIVLLPYNNVISSLGMLSSSAVLLLDPARITVGLYKAVNSETKIVESINPTVLLKSLKAEKEIHHIRQTMEQDGAAMCEFFAWFESALDQGESISELTVAEKIEDYRKERPGYVSLSFNTIAGFNENGALPHYHATPGNEAVIDRSGLLLIDSGGQYLGGTTDITRVAPIGEPSAQQKRDFTLVLKGLIALTCAHFPRSTRAPMLDAIARAPLWLEGMDYGHGTGHGIGYFLNVHEAPQSISYHAMPYGHTAMEEGMITSIEPGIYRAGHWGIRIENLVVNRKAPATEFGEYLCFETLTLCPIDTRCMDLSLLTHGEIAWINRYHAEVRHRLEPLLFGRARTWMISRTDPL